jgi:DNA recombination-mediator protein A
MNRAGEAASLQRGSTEKDSRPERHQTTLGALQLDCEVCRKKTTIARAPNAGGPEENAGYFGYIPAPQQLNRHAVENLFWACESCHREVRSWSTADLTSKLTQARRSGINPATLHVARPRAKAATRALPDVTPDVEREVGVTVAELSALYVLDGVKGFGPQKYKELHEAKLDPAVVIRDPNLLPTAGKTGQNLRGLLAHVDDAAWAECSERARRQIATAFTLKAKIVTYRSKEYPRSVYNSNDAVPALYVRGNLDVLQHKGIACVGSRGIKPPYTDMHERFAAAACKEGFTIVSGFATGADRVGHEAAAKVGGRTVCVMPCGLDRPFPPENADLWERLLTYDKAAFVSEFLFGLRASGTTLRTSPRASSDRLRGRGARARGSRSRSSLRSSR